MILDFIQNLKSSIKIELRPKWVPSLKEHAKNTISFEKNTMLSLTKKELKSHEDAKECYICGKGIKIIVITQGNKKPQCIVFAI